MYLIDVSIRHGIGVILDWVPSHFPTDAMGWVTSTARICLSMPTPRKGFHPDWKTFIFNYGRNEVRSFLMSSALFWLDKYHADGLRVDAVASMLYLDYSRKEGEWIPNQYGGQRKHRGHLIFCVDSTKRSIGAIPMSRRLPRSRRPGRWCRGRPMSADWASV